MLWTIIVTAVVYFALNIGLIVFLRVSPRREVGTFIIYLFVGLLVVFMVMAICWLLADKDDEDEENEEYDYHTRRRFLKNLN